VLVANLLRGERELSGTGTGGSETEQVLDSNEANLPDF